MIGKEYVTQKRISLMIVVIILVIGGAIYFLTGAVTRNVMEGGVTSNADISLFKDIQIKAAYTPNGAIKIFALAKNNILVNYPVSTGNNLPEQDSVVIGFDEAQMMIEENLFKKPGDSLTDLFGIDVTIEGILAKTGTFADDFHFINSEQFTELKGDSDVLLVKFKDPTTPKLFYLYDKENPSPVTIEFSDGSMALFYKHIVEKKVYYPVIIGATEAKMMQEEKLFAKVGDTIDGFFGKDVIIVGIIKETNTGLDMIHIVEKDFFEKNVEVVQGYLA
ncbi:MAG: hypothetical protein WC916_00070 [Candidatus Woesearchaeota archaeon]